MTHTDESGNGTAPGRERQPPTAREKVVLVGMMGSGKSTLGRAVAARAGCAFADVDAVVEADAGRPVREIFRLEGEAGFRRREAEAIRRLVAAPGPAVLATGGGCFCQDEVREFLGKHTYTVFLRVSEAELIRRLELADIAERPMLAADDWKKRVAELAGERNPHYRRAGMELDISDGEDPEHTAKRLLEALRLHWRH